jgi:hypothetical protein
MRVPSGEPADLRPRLATPILNVFTVRVNLRTGVRGSCGQTRECAGGDLWDIAKRRALR